MRWPYRTFVIIKFLYAFEIESKPVRRRRDGAASLTFI